MGTFYWAHFINVTTLKYSKFSNKSTSKDFFFKFPRAIVKAKIYKKKSISYHLRVHTHTYTYRERERERERERGL